MDKPTVIAIEGGIGSGKSTVCAIVAAMGYPVYDCDSQAKALMDSDESISRAIADKIGPHCVNPDGSINRPALSDTVFSSPDRLDTLNSIVHGAVRAHLASWIATRHDKVLFVETAILYQSGLDRMVDEVWHVDAPASVRLQRVMKRNGLTASQVKARMDAQDAYRPERVHPVIHTVINDGLTPVLPRVERLLAL